MNRYIKKRKDRLADWAMSKSLKRGGQGQKGIKKNIIKTFFIEECKRNTRENAV